MAQRMPVDRAWLVTALLTVTAATGLIDAVSFLRLGRVFVANMTGNVVFLGFAAYQGSGLSPVASVVAIAGFAAGAVAGGRVARVLSGGPRRWLCSVFAAQAIVLAVVAVLVAVGVLRTSGHATLVTVALLAMCFGLQNATVRKLAAHDLTTTVLTNTITGLVADSVLGGGGNPQVVRRLGSVLAMLAGALVGALLLRVGVPVVIGLAAVLVAGVASVFGRAPADTAADTPDGHR
ncbi:MAG TPA: YoaK family protein [Pseudonocardiaceae bacterium]|jgi:uncharacterized membrane protein YoaK (UPF0700 family)